MILFYFLRLRKSSCDSPHQRGGPRALIENLRIIRVRATLPITCSEGKLVTAYIVLQEGYFSLNRDELATAANDADA